MAELASAASELSSCCASPETAPRHPQALPRCGRSRKRHWKAHHRRRPSRRIQNHLLAIRVWRLSRPKPISVCKSSGTDLRARAPRGPDRSRPIRLHQRSRRRHREWNRVLHRRLNRLGSIEAMLAPRQHSSNAANTTASGPSAPCPVAAAFTAWCSAMACWSSRAVWSSVLVHQLEIRRVHGCLRVAKAEKLHALIVVRLDVERCKCVIVPQSLGGRLGFGLRPQWTTAESVILEKMSWERFSATAGLGHAWLHNTFSACGSLPPFRNTSSRH